MRIWTTESQPQHLQFSYWREVLAEAFVPRDPRRQRLGPGSTAPARVAEQLADWRRRLGPAG